MKNICRYVLPVIFEYNILDKSIILDSYNKDFYDIIDNLLYDAKNFLMKSKYKNRIDLPTLDIISWAPFYGFLNLAGKMDNAENETLNVIFEFIWNKNGKFSKVNIKESEDN